MNFELLEISFVNATSFDFVFERGRKINVFFVYKNCNLIIRNVDFS